MPNISSHPSASSVQGQYFSSESSVAGKPVENPDHAALSSTAMDAAALRKSNKERKKLVENLASAAFSDAVKTLYQDGMQRGLQDPRAYSKNAASLVKNGVLQPAGQYRHLLEIEAVVDCYDSVPLVAADTKQLTKKQEERASEFFGARNQCRENMAKIEVKRKEVMQLILKLHERSRLLKRDIKTILKDFASATERFLLVHDDALERMLPLWNRSLQMADSLAKREFQSAYYQTTKTAVEFKAALYFDYSTVEEKLEGDFINAYLEFEAGKKNLDAEASTFDDTLTERIDELRGRFLPRLENELMPALERLMFVRHGISLLPEATAMSGNDIQEIRMLCGNFCAMQARIGTLLTFMNAEYSDLIGSSGAVYSYSGQRKTSNYLQNFQTRRERREKAVNAELPIIAQEDIAWTDVFMSQRREMHKFVTSVSNGATLIVDMGGRMNSLSPEDTHQKLTIFAEKLNQAADSYDILAADFQTRFASRDFDIRQFGATRIKAGPETEKQAEMIFSDLQIRGSMAREQARCFRLIASTYVPAPDSMHVKNDPTTAVDVNLAVERREEPETALALKDTFSWRDDQVVADEDSSAHEHVSTQDETEPGIGEPEQPLAGEVTQLRLDEPGKPGITELIRQKEQLVHSAESHVADGRRELGIFQKAVVDIVRLPALDNAIAAFSKAAETYYEAYCFVRDSMKDFPGKTGTEKLHVLRRKYFSESVLLDAYRKHPVCQAVPDGTALDKIDRESGLEIVLSNNPLRKVGPAKTGQIIELIISMNVTIRVEGITATKTVKHTIGSHFHVRRPLVPSDLPTLLPADIVTGRRKDGRIGAIAHTKHMSQLRFGREFELESGEEIQRGAIELNQSIDYIHRAARSLAGG